MKLSIQHIAKLANLHIAKDETKIFESQLTDIIDYIGQLDEVDTKNVSPTSQVTGLTNVLRDDEEVLPSLTQEEALKNTKNSHNGFFVVSAILENK
jgi:aspartyl-tRNA(Asn)/glutamyl-tRNA(Gln) amidotransferase subunit C